MNITVLGGSGFVGLHLVSALLDRDHVITVVGRSREKAVTRHWFDRVRFVEADLYDADLEVGALVGDDCDAVIDLAWPGLPHFDELYHFERNTHLSYRMLKKFVEAGVPQLLIAGTCFEYGLQEGMLGPECKTDPVTSYGIAKDALRRALEKLHEERDFTLQWARLFYVYGEGQNPGSLLSQLEAAIRNKDESFPMSPGDQLRDFLPVEEAAEQLATLLQQSQLSACVNICSAVPTSVRSLVESRINELDGDIRLELGVFEYPTYEPMAFWGEPATFLASNNEQ